MKKIIPTLTAMALPFVTLAQDLTTTPGSPTVPDVKTDLTEVLDKVSNILSTLIPIIITLGVIYFFWGVIQYVTAKDEEKKKEARSVMISGIIGLFVILSIWGIIALLGNFLGVGQGGGPVGGVPTVPTVR